MHLDKQATNEHNSKGTLRVRFQSPGSVCRSLSTSSSASSSSSSSDSADTSSSHDGTCSSTCSSSSSSSGANSSRQDSSDGDSSSSRCTSSDDRSAARTSSTSSSRVSVSNVKRRPQKIIRTSQSKQSSPKCKCVMWDACASLKCTRLGLISALHPFRPRLPASTSLEIVCPWVPLH